MIIIFSYKETARPVNGTATPPLAGNLINQYRNNAVNKYGANFSLPPNSTSSIKQAI